MGLYTSGLIGVTPVKMKSVLSLDELAEQARTQAYPRVEGRPSSGWGSSLDDDSAVNQPVISRVTVGAPELVSEDGDVARRLRLRFYWDRLDNRLRRNLGDAVPWNRIYARQAVDVIVFDDKTDCGRSVLVSSRNYRDLTSEIIPALRTLGGEKCSLETQNIAESLDPDLFTWLLWKLQSAPALDDAVTLESIREINSKDRQFRGARFTEDATIDRIEMAALVAMGKMRFGPAKVGLGDSGLEAVFDLELHPDGGLSVYRSSYYEKFVPPGDLCGHKMVEDLWSTVLPRVRDAYTQDSVWRATGRESLERLAVEAIRAILPPLKP